MFAPPENIFRGYDGNSPTGPETMRDKNAENDDLRLLRALCQADDSGLVRRACHVLGRHDWPQGESRIVFECCAALAARGARITAASLAAEATRAGFPDVDLESLFAALPSADRELARRLDALEKESG
ncbi:MAG: hypothetical protein KGL59_15015 [Acidobacteriota bacterium]|nr:hypothetical protein [Acidobacteriota bacterium]